MFILEITFIHYITLLSFRIRSAYVARKVIHLVQIIRYYLVKAIRILYAIYLLYTYGQLFATQLFFNMCGFQITVFFLTHLPYGKYNFHASLTRYVIKYMIIDSTVLNIVSLTQNTDY